MKVKVIHGFRDRHTGERYTRGAVLGITEERYNEIMRVGDLVLKIAAGASEDDNANTLSNDNEEASRNDSGASGDGFDMMSVRELREYADATYKMTFKGGMKKADIIAALRRMEKNGK